MRLPLALFAFALFATTASAGSDMFQRDGFAVMPTSKSYHQLVSDVREAAKANGMGIVTQAGPTETAKKRGITIPGNRIIGIFNNDFAVKILGLSTAAMIEAPIRMYVTENEDGTATLSYKQPTVIYAPYLDEGGAALANLAQQLEDRFAVIAQAATQ